MIAQNQDIRLNHKMAPSIVKSTWTLLLALVFFQVIAQTLNYSFFFDGGIHSAAARNLVEGKGSLWSPYFNETLFPVFSEHPPLMIWLQAVGFWIFGDTIVVEKTFSFLTFLASGFLLYKLWSLLNDDDHFVQQAAPFALALTLIAGRVNWSFYNGMLENLVVVFSLSAVLLIVLAYRPPQPASTLKRVSLVGSAALLICLAVMTKGPVGLFAFAAPAIYWLTLRGPKLSVVIIDTLIMAAIIAAFFVTLWQFADARAAIERYLDAQVFASLSGDRGSSGGGLYALRKILGVNGYALAVVLLAFIAARIWSIPHTDPKHQKSRYQRAAFLLIIGLSASLPIAISPRVYNHYFTPSLPFFTAGLTILAAPILMTALRGMSGQWQGRLKVISIALLVIGIGYAAGNFKRGGADGQIIDNAAKIAAVVCENEQDCGVTISACDELWRDWALHTYMQRYYKVSIAKAPPPEAAYMIADEQCSIPHGFTDTNAGTETYRLFKR
jgi:4-amino-4-deoxy-L-arabinose transferase-like glycosyltransferase